jgi:predicted phosphoribosyltransferase
MLFRDRSDAGRALAAHLKEYARRPDVVVLGLPRGGVVVASEVAQALGAPLDVLIVRKLGVPGHAELAMGAIAGGGVRFLDRELIRRLGIADEVVEATTALETRELERREEAYRLAKPPPEVRGRTVLLVDDGLATGATMRAAVASLRERGPARIVVAVPVGSSSTCAELGAEADAVVCARTPEPFLGVGAWYDDFRQTSDDEVRSLLERASPDQGPASEPKYSAS